MGILFYFFFTLSVYFCNRQEMTASCYVHLKGVYQEVVDKQKKIKIKKVGCLSFFFYLALP